MRGRGRFGADEEEVKPDLSPMIDCIFILLIFFIVTTVFVEEEGVDVTRPDSSESASSLQDSNSVILQITAENKIVCDQKEYAINEVQSLVRERIADEKDTPVIIQGDIKASHGVVTQVFDQTKAAGAIKITTSTT